MTDSSPLAPLSRQEQSVLGIASTIRDAAIETGVSFEFLLAQAKTESQLDPMARNKRSSAKGLFQFTAQTWLGLLKEYGGKYDVLGANLIKTDANGRLTVDDPEASRVLLDLRKDPKLSALLAAEYARDNQEFLEKRLKREVNDHDLYLAHFLGPYGALSVMRADAEQAGPHELTSAARSNPEIFEDDDGPKPLAQVYAEVEARFKKAKRDARKLALSVMPSLDLSGVRPKSRPLGPAAEAPDVTLLDILRSLLPDKPGLLPHSPYPVAIGEAEDQQADHYPVPVPPPLTTEGKDRKTASFPVAIPPLSPPLSPATMDALLFIQEQPDDL